ncbi:putative coil containing protein [Vibrio phage 417E50-1]|nr:putative coil containing protein [Vibrio phage 417E50-1]
MAGGFQSNRKAGDFPSTGRTAGDGGSGTGEVDTVNGISPDAAGNVQLTASDVGAHSRGDADSKFEPKRATGTIGAADDPTKKPEGDYYVNEGFIGAPTIASGNYVGVMRIDLDFDGSNNGGLIVYVTDAAVFYKPKFAGGWGSAWIETPKAQAAMSRTLSALSSEEQTLEAKVTEIEKEVAALGGGGAAPRPAFDSSIFQSAVSHGYAADDQGVKSSKTTDGWWVFKGTNTARSMPPNSTGEVIIFKKKMDVGNLGLKYFFVMAIGKDAQLKNTIWFMYRDGTSWTPWFTEQGAQQSTIDALSSSVDELKRANQATVDEVSKLNTAIGKVYSPGSKAAFDDDVNALIKNYLAQHDSKEHGGNSPRLVLPEIHVLFDTGVPTALTNEISSTTGKVNIKRALSTQERLWVLVEKSAASKVKSIQVGDDIASMWQTRDVTIDGTAYTGFYSAGGFGALQETLTVKFE